jgi:hypothetical protein
MNEKNENKAMKQMGWMAAVAALVLAGVFAISGAPRVDARVPEISKASVSTSSAHLGDAHADSDTCDLQLD